MAKVFRVVESIPHEEGIGCIEAYPAGFDPDSGKSFVQKRANIEPGGAPSFQTRKQAPKCRPAVDDVLHHQHRSTLERRGWIVEQADLAR